MEKAEATSWCRGFSRREAIVGAVSGALCLGAESLGARDLTAPKPNIVFLLADDLRHDAIGYQNEAVRTPNLDKLATDAVRFHNAFVTTAICCTSRASIFTGMYARRHGVWDFEATLSPAQLQVSYPAVLQRAGYRTGFFGKYGVGAVDATGDSCNVHKNAGFDVMDDRGFAYFLPNDTEKRLHSNVHLAEQSEQFIRTASKSQPFCLSVSFNAPHGAVNDEMPAEEEMLALYADVQLRRGALCSEEAFSTLPVFLRESAGREWWKRSLSSEQKWEEYVKRYYALVSGIDRAVGRILSALEETNRAEDTVVIFTSDNGFFLGDYGLHGKWFGYESSIRVPLLIRPINKPAVKDVYETALNIDLAPTMVSLAGLNIPAAMQGCDLSRLWTGSRLIPGSWRSDFLYEHRLRSHPAYADVERAFPTSEGVRTNRYTYLRYPLQSGGHHEQLFDRASDAHELRNIVRSVPAKLVAQLRQRTNELAMSSL